MVNNIGNQGNMTTTTKLNKPNGQTDVILSSKNYNNNKSSLQDDKISLSEKISNTLVKEFPNK